MDDPEVAAARLAGFIAANRYEAGRAGKPSLMACVFKMMGARFYVVLGCVVVSTACELGRPMVFSSLMYYLATASGAPGEWQKWALSAAFFLLAMADTVCHRKQDFTLQRVGRQVRCVAAAGGARVCAGGGEGVCPHVRGVRRSGARCSCTCTGRRCHCGTARGRPKGRSSTS